ncbi:hypothetical protein M378DRAFT_164932, partial [Amanita muscaria Koide BX008]
MHAEHDAPVLCDFFFYGGGLTTGERAFTPPYDVLYSNLSPSSRTAASSRKSNSRAPQMTCTKPSVGRSITGSTSSTLAVQTVFEAAGCGSVSMDWRNKSG